MRLTSIKRMKYTSFACATETEIAFLKGTPFSFHFSIVFVQNRLHVPVRRIIKMPVTYIIFRILFTFAADLFVFFRSATMFRFGNFNPIWICTAVELNLWTWPWNVSALHSSRRYTNILIFKNRLNSLAGLNSSQLVICKVSFICQC